MTIDSRVIYTAEYTCRFLPIVLLALVFNLSNLLGFTYVPTSLSSLRRALTCRYADRDAQRRWASNIASSGNLLGFGMGGLGGQLVGGMVRNSFGRLVR